MSQELEGSGNTSDLIDVICDEFDRAWRAGMPMRLEELLNKVTSSQRARLFAELLKVELEYRHSGSHVLSSP